MSVPSAPPVWIDYDYAVVRIMPSVARGAFVNVGVVLHARRARFLEARLHPEVATMEDLAVLSGDLLQGALRAYAAVCNGHGVIGCYPPSERFHWLTAPRSAALRTSPVHSGRTTDPAVTLVSLYQTLVAR